MSLNLADPTSYLVIGLVFIVLVLFQGVKKQNGLRFESVFLMIILNRRPNFSL